MQIDGRRSSFLCTGLDAMAETVGCLNIGAGRPPPLHKSGNGAFLDTGRDENLRRCWARELYRICTRTLQMLALSRLESSPTLTPTAPIDFLHLLRAREPEIRSDAAPQCACNDACPIRRRRARGLLLRKEPRRPPGDGVLRGESQEELKTHRTNRWFLGQGKTTTNEDDGHRRPHTSR